MCVCYVSIRERTSVFPSEIMIEPKDRVFSSFVNTLKSLNVYLNLFVFFSACVGHSVMRSQRRTVSLHATLSQRLYERIDMMMSKHERSRETHMILRLIHGMYNNIF